MSKEKEYTVLNSDGDFLQVQNYVLQLVAEKKISKSAFVLYSFYRSIAGFDIIRMGYRYISENSGVSTGSITECNKMLVENNLIKIENSGPLSPFVIEIIPGFTLPRRRFKEPDRSYLKEKEIIKTEDHEKLRKHIISVWKKHTKSRYYTKDDGNKVYEIIDPIEAMKYVETMWSLDEVDKWTRQSDHTVSVFVHLYLAGKLQAHYEKTKASRRLAYDLD